jgi:hypothetical protein
MVVERIALEPRSGIWLMFYETLVDPCSKRCAYEQELLRIFKGLGHAKEGAIIEFRKRSISAPLVIRDDSQKDRMYRRE